MTNSTTYNWIQAQALAEELYAISQYQLGNAWADAAIMYADPGESHLEDPRILAVDWMLEQMSALFSEMVSLGHMNEDDMNQEAWDALWSMIDAGLLETVMEDI